MAFRYVLEDREGALRWRLRSGPLSAYGEAGQFKAVVKLPEAGGKARQLRVDRGGRGLPSDRVRLRYRFGGREQARGWHDPEAPLEDSAARAADFVRDATGEASPAQADWLARLATALHETSLVVERSSVVTEEGEVLEGYGWTDLVELSQSLPGKLLGGAAQAAAAEPKPQPKEKPEVQTLPGAGRKAAARRGRAKARSR